MKKTFSIKGMHCNSCAILIEKELKDKVNNVSASYSKEQAEIDFDENKISEEEIKDVIKKLGYEIEGDDVSYKALDKEIKEEVELKSSEALASEPSPAQEKPKNTEDSFKSEKQEENLRRDLVSNKKSRYKKIEKNFKKNITEIENISYDERFSATTWVVIIGSIAIFLFSLYYFNVIQLPDIKIPDIKIPENGEKIGLVLLFLAGILTGFHCISMCGGFVVSYTAKNAINGHKSFKQHLVYGGSKVISYTIIGGIFGLIGGIFAFSIGLRAGVAIFAGIFMIFYSLSMFGIKFFRKFQFNPKFLTKFTMKASANAKGPYKGPMITGLLNGLFIACGPLQAMYLYAAGTGSFVGGATSLAVFGLGTLPIMIGFGSFATVISHKTTKKILKISAILVLVLGLIMLNRGLTMIGSPYNYESIKTKLIGANVIQQGTSSVITNGIQEINMDVSGNGYSPNSFVLKKGVPVKWNINVKQLTGCNSELIANEYNIDINLKQGLNTAEFTPDKEGTFSFSCGMGMIRGSFIVTETGTASQQQVAIATPPKGMQCSGAGGGGCGCGG